MLKIDIERFYSLAINSKEINLKLNFKKGI